MMRTSNGICLFLLAGALGACGGHSSSSDAGADRGTGGQAGGAGGGARGGTGGSAAGTGGAAGGGGANAGAGGTGASAGIGGNAGTGGNGGSAGGAGTAGGGRGGNAGNAGGIGGNGGTGGGGAGGGGRGGSAGTAGNGGLDGSVTDASSDRPADAMIDTGASDRGPDSTGTDGPRDGATSDAAICQTAADCAANQTCVLPAGQCQCPTQFRVCGGVCGPDSPTRCGASCRVCPGTANGDAVCTAGACDIACHANFAPCTAGCCRGFAVERVDAPIAGGGDDPIALTFDAAGAPHAVFADPTNYAVVYATRAGGVWNLEEVDGGDIYPDSYDSTVSIAVDSVGDVHIAYPVNADQLRYARRTAGIWMRETIEPLGTEVNQASIAVDASRTVHVAYDVIDGGVVSLRHAWRAPAESAWHYETVDGDAATSVGLHASLALDAAGHPRIAYFDSTNADLKYASFDGVGWRIETVESAGDLGEQPWLTLDAQGRPVIFYQDTTHQAVRLAEWTGTAWTLSTPVNTNPAVYGMSVAIDGTGAPWIAFYDNNISRPVLYRRSGTTWTRQLYDPIDRGGRRTAVVTDPSGVVELAFTTSNLNDGLHLTHLIAGVWTDEAIDDRVAAGYQNDLALDASGRPHIAYLKASSFQVWYATRDAAGVWTRRPVGATGGDVAFGPSGGFPTIAVEPAGRPHVVWYNGDATDLLHAVWDGSTWVTDVVDPMPGSQPWPSLAVDASGQPRVVYTSPSGALIYAVKSGAGYTTETAVAVGQYPSLALDASGTPHVSYYESVGKTTGYAHRTATGWVSETVGTAAGSYPSSGIAVDGTGNIHVCWTSLISNYLALRYATRSSGWSASGPANSGTSSVGCFCSIAVDAQNQPHISHQVNSTLYSRLVAGTWITTPIDAYTYGGATSIALDAQGTPQISYSHAQNKQIKYARQE